MEKVRSDICDCKKICQLHCLIHGPHMNSSHLSFTAEGNSPSASCSQRSADD